MGAQYYVPPFSRAEEDKIVEALIRHNIITSEELKNVSNQLVNASGTRQVYITNFNDYLLGLSVVIPRDDEVIGKLMTRLHGPKSSPQSPNQPVKKEVEMKTVAVSKIEAICDKFKQVFETTGFSMEMGVIANIGRYLLSIDTSPSELAEQTEEELCDFLIGLIYKFGDHYPELMGGPQPYYSGTSPAFPFQPDQSLNIHHAHSLVGGDINQQLNHLAYASNVRRIMIDITQLAISKLKGSGRVVNFRGSGPGEWISSKPHGRWQ